MPRSEQVTEKVANWKHSGVHLCAPMLWEYQVASVLRKAVVAGWMSTDDAVDAMRSIRALNIQCTPPTLELHAGALRWAVRLGQTKAYDAHYLALAEELHADLWTADKRLTSSARQRDVTWVYGIEGLSVVDDESV